MAYVSDYGGYATVSKVIKDTILRQAALRLMTLT